MSPTWHNTCRTPQRTKKRLGQMCLFVQLYISLSIYLFKSKVEEHKCDLTPSERADLCIIPKKNNDWSFNVPPLIGSSSGGI